MRKKLLQLTALTVVALGATAYTFGGWAVITVEDLPEHITVGQPTTISFMVRQHGVSLLNGLRPELVAKDTKDPKSEVRVSATAGATTGEYSANLAVPRAGDWTITINSGFMNAHVTLYPVTSIVPGSRAPAADAPAERGQRLFMAKGCVTCHVHGSVAGSGTIAVGPNLTPKRYQAEYLARYLTDPSIARTPGMQAVMPKLELKTAEVASLVAFINSDRQVSSK
jgi:mono/diheme cytochrome c family protein